MKKQNPKDAKERRKSRTTETATVSAVSRSPLLCDCAIVCFCHLIIHVSVCIRNNGQLSSINVSFSQHPYKLRPHLYKLYQIRTNSVPNLYKLCTKSVPNLYKLCTNSVPNLYKLCAKSILYLYLTVVAPIKSCMRYTPLAFINCFLISKEYTLEEPLTPRSLLANSSSYPPPVFPLVNLYIFI